MLILSSSNHNTLMLLQAHAGSWSLVLTRRRAVGGEDAILSAGGQHG